MFESTTLHGRVTIVSRNLTSYVAIKSVVDKIKLIDTHEHLPQESERIKGKPDPFATFLIHYISSDLVSAGMPKDLLYRVRDVSLPLNERWRLLAPFWERIQNTGYARALNLAVKGLYGIDGLNERTCKDLELKMRSANKLGLYRWVLKEKAGVDLSILDNETVDVDRSLFAPVIRFDDFILLKERGDIEALERKCEMKIHSLSDLTEALRLRFEKLSKSIVGVKIALAYRRPINFEKTTSYDAERVFNKIYSQKVFRRIELPDGSRVNVPEGISFEEAKPLQDFIVHKVIQLSGTLQLPIQVHTGLQEGNENVIASSNPVHLVNLFMEYKEVKFDLFHGGYPYTSEVATLAKNFPNVYVDLCWLHIISPAVARRVLSELLDTVPSNKILGFGGDYRFVEGVYGHALLARENTARVLTEKVEDGSLAQKGVLLLAQRLLRDNANELYFKRGRR